MKGPTLRAASSLRPLSFSPPSTTPCMNCPRALPIGLPRCSACRLPGIFWSKNLKRYPYIPSTYFPHGRPRQPHHSQPSLLATLVGLVFSETLVLFYSTQERTNTMNRTLILLGLLTLSSCTTSVAFATDKPDLRTYPPRDTYERQLQDYQRHGYDSQRNGSLSQESNIQRENDSYQQQEQHRQGSSEHSQDYRQGNTWGNSRDNTGGQYGGQCLYGC